MTDKVALAVEFIRAAAQRCEPCPTNGQLATKFGYQGIASGARLVALAVQVGLIQVHRGNASRVVVAADGSWRTAGEVQNLHWRERRGQEVGKVRIAPSGHKDRGDHRSLRDRPKNTLGALQLQAPAVPPGASPQPAEATARPVEEHAPAEVNPMCEDRSAGDEPGRLGAGHSCRWPLWGDRERPTHRYCDAPRGDGSYCAEHADRASGRGAWAERQADGCEGVAA